MPRHFLPARRWRAPLALAVILSLGVSFAPFPMTAQAEPSSETVRDPEFVDIDPIEALPDLRGVAAGPQRKAAFLELIVPLVEAENARIAADRQWLLALRDRKGALDETEQTRLANICDRYDLKCDEGKVDNRLLLRVDTLPLEMVVIQAVEESGWGTSRFARQGNNLFGLRCFSQHCGIGQQGSSRRYQSFATVQESVRAYLHNLNTHRAYQSMRKRRATLASGGKPVNAADLIPMLESYSIRDDYFDVLLSLLRTNAPLIRYHSSEDSPA
ncbi:protein bax [Halomonas sp. WWR20]